ncbi:hypothetical protein K432DRAFT_383482, partial [Lepidopterella palustris CBS 459.81]
MADSPAPTHPAFSLLLRAHSPDTATRLFATRIAHKPLPLRPSSPTPSGRSLRRIHRNARAAVEKKRAAHKPRPLSAAQKRGMGLFEIPKAQREYRIYEGLHGMWVGYMREILGLDGEGGERNCVSPQGAGVMIASADMHGAEVEVVRSRCVSRVGLRGIVVRDAKFIFEIITKENILKKTTKGTHNLSIRGPACCEAGPGGA